MTLRHRHRRAKAACCKRNAHRLEGRAVGLVSATPPTLGRSEISGERVGQRVAFTWHELELEIHRRAHSRNPLCRRRTAASATKAIVELRGVEIVVFDLQERIEALEILQQRLHAGRVRRRINHQLAFPLERWPAAPAALRRRHATLD